MALAWLLAHGCGGRAPAEASPERGAGGPASTQPAEPEPEVEAEPPREPLASYMQRFAIAAEPEAEAPPGSEAGGCPDRGERDGDLGIVISPRRPAKGQPVRVLAATLSSEEALALRVEFGGEALELEVEHRRGVPAATVAEFVPRRSGTYRVFVGRAGEGLRCRKFGVRDAVYRDKREVDLSKVWELERAWTASEEALFSAWVRELFIGAVDEDLAWKALSEVTSDVSRNLLHNHLGRSEDDPTTGLELIPDCADTPYFLRAYWSFKRGLPFGFRKCSRGRGRPPTCFDLNTNLDLPDRRYTWIDPEPPEPSADEAAAVGTGLPPSATGPTASPIGGDGLLVDGGATAPPPPPPPPPGAKVPTPNEKIEYYFRRTIGWGVHTGNGRCAYGDSESDFYPVALDRRGLRPGVIYADPYGHILVLVELVAPRGSRPGILFAIDGQPDGSITRKRFWEGNFLWNQADPSLGGSGFKAFRPLTAVGEGDSRSVVQISDETLAEMRSYGDVSSMQQELSATQFYDLMERLITPGVRSPFAAQAELVAALAEAVRVRRTSVDNGVAYVAANPDEPIEMPWGHKVFETSGSWENYSTPARDLRLLIAMDVVLGFADKVERNPASFGLASPDGEVDAERLATTLEYLAQQRAELLADPAHSVSYTRSDGSSWTLGLDEVVARIKALELAYNPNDCPELRWAAPADSEEASTCQRRAPQDQQIKMRYYQSWFAERRRPARGDRGPEIPELAEQQAAAFDD